MAPIRPNEQQASNQTLPHDREQSARRSLVAASRAPDAPKPEGTPPYARRSHDRSTKESPRKGCRVSRAWWAGGVPSRTGALPGRARPARVLAPAAQARTSVPRASTGPFSHMPCWTRDGLNPRAGRPARHGTAHWPGMPQPLKGEFPQKRIAQRRKKNSSCF
jgi:hypothetical protein